MSVQRCDISDGNDTLVSTAGQTARLLGAVFGVASLSNKVCAGIGLSMLDAVSSVGALTVLAADTELNAANINRVGLVQTGLGFTS